MNIPDTTPTPSPFLQSFISRTLRVTTTDTRVFLGELKCTDKDKNLILSSTHEYRYPSAQDVSAAAAAEKEGGETVKLDLKSRYIGLVVVPGEHVVKIEVEEKGQR
ncbi:uncharacterized protein H6S33_011760 [Morchella sextelata]|uniref:uncharacterized protein n=1 Tax=Morchella sextelata TaxID=1174677 RepID=UPI001D0375A5|nr:uncharacterized protein H6S33_011760 [Morchella sextelata]KAH0610233.1 hypothetical protein H6S33_011760 [Morchella sextelata]